MTEPAETVANGEATGRASVTVGGSPLREDVAARLLRAVVDNDAHLPGMFELTFLDPDGSTLGLAGLSIGAPVEIGGAGPSGEPLVLISGEVTSVEGLLAGMTMRTAVRGYTREHRLQRAKRSRSFVNVTDSDVARQIATQAGLTPGDVATSTVTHAYLAQVNQTDWDFLDCRAREIGYEFGVTAGVFHFRPVAGGAAAGSHPVAVPYPDKLISFRPRITAGNLTPDVEVRSWDPLARKAVAQVVATPGGGEHSPASLGRMFAASGGPAGAANGLASALTSAVTGRLSSVVNDVGSAMSPVGGMLGSPVGDLGPVPSPTAHVQVGKPFASAITMPVNGPVVANAAGTDAGSTFAEAEGEVKGNAAIQPGAWIEVSGVQSVFAGSWRVSRARHVFDESEHGYRVIFSAHGRQDRSVVGLASRGASGGGERSVLDSVVCGVVADCADPLGKGRVKVTLPWLSPEFETDWAPNVQFAAGQRTGASFLPEVGDEVLVAFEFGDVRRPYVLGGMINNLTTWNVASSGPVMAGGPFAVAGVAGVQSGDLSSFLSPLGGGLGSTGSPLPGMPGLGDLGSVPGMPEMPDLPTVPGMPGTDSPSQAGSVVTPGLVSEIHHRGFVSSTGNSLLFYDVPMPLGAPPSGGTGGGAGAVAGGLAGAAFDIGMGAATSGNPVGGGAGLDAIGSIADGVGAGLGSGGQGGPPSPGIGALASAARLGSQNGEIGLTVDQVNAGVSINAQLVPGVSLCPMPSVSITAQNGLVYLGAGESGATVVNAGTAMGIVAQGTITLTAETVNIVGLLTVNGLPIPL
ncbi:phage baseplate assembly protein V [Lentzea sp.]|uniref:phage baseplate assembly protein V n=1 Tax=Lentzea sp. TaxID=56099 RepID=UPI002BF5F031|nr:phage baseplate assembly protein V [Lentzea sp.]HUQ57196.1 phage baseplate assembly protein V [Lentzea sp.]